jgi:hypothetical protein
MELPGKALDEGFPQVMGENGVQFDGMNGATGFQHGQGQRPESRADFHDLVARLESRQLKGFTDNISIDEEILPERLSRAVSERLKKGARL